ncbi:hypothetical protein BGW37DRAFT_556298 [Umbelopsis sp. PMI_123]|nr:hypothetical protein BGW37DRAFT_556298 [Umbelopsis sp. PMI_123]
MANLLMDIQLDGLPFYFSSGYDELSFWCSLRERKSTSYHNTFSRKPNPNALRMERFNRFGQTTSQISRLDELACKTQKIASANKITTDGYAINFLFARKKASDEQVHNVQLDLEDFTANEIDDYFQPVTVDPGRIKYPLHVMVLAKKKISLHNFKIDERVLKLLCRPQVAKAFNVTAKINIPSDQMETNTDIWEQVFYFDNIGIRYATRNSINVRFGLKAHDIQNEKRRTDFAEIEENLPTAQTTGIRQYHTYIEYVLLVDSTVHGVHIRHPNIHIA